MTVFYLVANIEYIWIYILSMQAYDLGEEIMSYLDMQREIRKYTNLKYESEEKLRELEEELQEVFAFKSKYELGKADFYNNINNRRNRAENVNSIAEKMKMGKVYYGGMNEDLTGAENRDILNKTEEITERIDEIIRFLENQIEEVKRQIQRYDNLSIERNN